MQLYRIESDRQLNAFCTMQGATQISARSPALHQADELWIVFNGTLVTGRCSLWWSMTPAYPLAHQSSLIDGAGGRLGLIGHFAAHDAESANLLLTHAGTRLREQDATLAVGPMDGNTFRSYTFLTERTFDGVHLPPYLTEPDNPPEWPHYWRQHGFQPLAHYFSAMGELPEQYPRLNVLVERAVNAGIRIRRVDMSRFEQELAKVYSVVARTYVDTFLYSPIGKAEFIEQYATVKNYLHPDLILLAERGGDTVGFIFNIPDLAQAARNETVDTIIVKTVAVAPDASGLGLASLLVEQSHLTARSLGFKRMIHTLLYEDEETRKVSRRYARIMRRYTLFARRL